MGEKSLIERTPKPRTRESIGEDLRNLGLEEGMTVLVHTSLSALGWVNGGSVAVIQALMDVVTESGTLIMPTQSGDYGNPELWENPPVPKSWIKTIKDTMPAYDPAITPTRGMGVIVETFRKFPDVIRSSHPQNSFGAWGKHAKEIIKNHPLEYSLGEASPLGRLYELDSMVLFLGTNHESNTSFHLAEYRVEGAKSCYNEAPIIEEGKRAWKKFKDIEFNEELFQKIGVAFEDVIKVKRGKVGSAECRLFNQRLAVDFAQSWLSNYHE